MWNSSKIGHKQQTRKGMHQYWSDLKTSNDGTSHISVYNLKEYHTELHPTIGCFTQFLRQDFTHTAQSVWIRVRCFQQLKHQTEEKVLNCTLLSFEFSFLRGFHSWLFSSNSIINPDWGIAMSQTWNLPLQTDYRLILSDRQPSCNSHSSMGRNSGQYSNSVIIFLFLFFFFISFFPF